MENTVENKRQIDFSSFIKSFDFKYLLNVVLELITKPKEAWKRIQSEELSTKDLYVRVMLVPLMIIALANFLKSSILGIDVPLLGVVRTGVFDGLTQSITLFIVWAASAYILSYVLNFISKLEFFNCEISQNNSLKLIAFVFLVACVSSVLTLLPAGVLFALLYSLYALYILYLGIAEFSQSDKSVILAIVFVISSIVVGGALSFILFSIVA